MSEEHPLTPEQVFGAAILQQAWKDLRHPYLRVREDAHHFWSTPDALRYWDDLLGMEGALVRRCLPAAATPPEEITS